MDDPIGEAIKEFFEKGKAPDISIDTNYTKDETILPAYFFRGEENLPPLEKEAVKMCKGTVLDVGAAAGCHSLLLQKKGFNVTALDNSALSVEVMRKRGIVKVVNADIFDYDGQQFNTILLLMNGSGIGGTIDGFEKLLVHLKQLLAEGGQILIDSSNIKYLFEEEDGSVWVDLANEKYYGEMQYEVTFRKRKAEFNWLFVDLETLKNIAQKTGFKCDLLAEGENGDYLSRLKIIQ